MTKVFLQPALDALPRVKAQRKIFFLLAWLNAFIEGQNAFRNAEEADAEVHRWLASAHLDHDLELKVLQVVNELDRTVKIRAQFP